MPNVIVIGGGIVGGAIALYIARRGLAKVTVLEKEPSLGHHASGRNSGVIHSGINQKPGTLKARMCVEGSRLLREYCRQRKVPMVECGTLVVARAESERKSLETLFELGKQCGVPDLRLLDHDELERREPGACGVQALLSPTGAVVDSLGLLKTVAQEAESLGVEFRYGHEVVGIDSGRVTTSHGTFQADHIVNCAGLYADKIAHWMGVGLEYQVIPFRGEYMEVSGCDVRSMIYRVPDPRFPFLSIHLTRETDGRVLAGPSAVLAFGREAYDKEWHWRETAEMFASGSFWRMALRPSFLRLACENAKTSFSKGSFLREIQSLVPSVRREQLKPARSGIRAQMVDRQGKLVEDILVHYGQDSTHVLNAVSPGMTSSLAFAEHVVREMTARW